MSESKVKKSALSFPVTFEKVEDIESADGRFTKVRIWLMHLGENFNGSIFEKDVVDNAISTLEYIQRKKERNEIYSCFIMYNY